MEIVPGGVIVKRLGCGRVNGQGESAKRGKVRGFSRAARRRCMEKLMRLNWSELSAKSKHAPTGRAVFITLTYPETDFRGWQQWKAHLKAFLQRLRRSGFDVQGVFWKLEPQPDRSKKAGQFVPHFHVLAEFKRPVNKQRFRAWLSRAWYEVVGSGDEKHLRAGTQAQVVYGAVGRLMGYLSKYLGKTFETEATLTGRVWGVWGQLSEGAAQACVLSEREAVEVMRRLRAWGKRSRYLRGVGRRNNLYRITEGQATGPLGFMAFGIGEWVLRGLEGRAGAHWSDDNV